MSYRDITIIGAGPVGLFAVFQAGMLKMNCHVVDTLDFIGGQCNALYPEKPIYDIPAHPAIAAEDLIAKLEQQAAPFHPLYHLGQQVTAISNDNGIWRIGTTAAELESKAIIIAAGCGAFGPNRPPLESIENYEGVSVRYMVGRREDFRGKRVVIAGGGDSAVDWAISLQEVAAKVMVVHRRDKFRAAPESEARLKQLADDGKIDLVVPYQLHALEGDGSELAAVMVKSLDGDVKRLDADFLLPFFGLSMQLGPIAEWGLGLDKHHITVNPATMQTSREGVFAIGDIATYPGKLKLILCGFSEAAMALHAAYPLVHPNESLHFEYSTTKGISNA